MKVFNKLAAAGLAGAVILAAGCANNNPGTQPPVTESETAASQATESTEVQTPDTAVETTDSVVTEVSVAAHDVSVEEIKKLSSDQGDFEYNSVAPKLIVDGNEATEINDSLSKYIEENYPLDIDGDYPDGMSTKLVWGVKDNIVSIVICARSTDSDYFTREAFNYDLDTLEELDDSEVVKRLGMTDDEFFGKTSDIVKKYCDGKDYDLEKCLAAVNYDKITPFIMPDGTPGVICCIVYGQDSQFMGLESGRGFNMTTMEFEV